MHARSAVSSWDKFIIICYKFLRLPVCREQTGLDSHIRRTGLDWIGLDSHMQRTEWDSHIQRTLKRWAAIARFKLWSRDSSKWPNMNKLRKLKLASSRETWGIRCLMVNPLLGKNAWQLWNPGNVGGHNVAPQDYYGKCQFTKQIMPT